MTAPYRTETGGRIDRSSRYEFTFDGRTYTGHRGDTLASALLAHGVRKIASSVKLGRPRGISAAWAEDTGGLVQIEAPFPEPMLLASTVELHDGLAARGLPGQGRLADIADSARYDAMHAHADVLVVGAGPAGLTAALAAARSGARVVLVDEQSEAGGSLLGGNERIDDAAATEWVRTAVDELATYPEVRHLQRTTAFGHYDDGFVLALERRTDHLGAAAPAGVSRQRVWRIRARHVLIATGAHERPIVFADNDLPGIMLAHSARTFLHRYGVLVGRTSVVFTTNDSAYAAAFDLADAGVHIEAIVDARTAVSERLRQECEQRDIPLRAGAVVTGTRGADCIVEALVADFDGVNVDAVEPVSCDTLLVSGGWNPAVHLFSQVRGVLRYDAALGAFVPHEQLAGVSVAGSANGVMDLEGCLREGRDSAASALGLAPQDPLPEVLDVPASPGLVLWRVPGRDQDQFVDVQRDATVADVARAVGAGMRSVEHIKRYTTIGTAHDQGKTSGVIASGITAELLGLPIEALGTTTFRPPYTPVAFAALAGRDRGALFDPVRTTALHDWHIAQGAVFEDVGQWKRPRHYPHPGEDMDAAVLRECASARSGVGILDGSTLGKIDVQGRDAAELLDRIYTNLMSSLKVGSIRYGVMCGVDGMVIDDGTVLRVAEDRFLVYTTTGGAAKILDWMEEWLQTEWPQLQVALTSVTDHLATFPVVGPRSRDVIGAVFGDLDVSNDAFPFMTWRDTSLDDVPIRVARVSFSGELAYEVNVNAWHAPAVWERLLEAGRRHGITPYGTETMHVLRAEKGYPIIGQDTDGTVSPHDLGMAWAVSKKKPDFIGKRSFSRVENQNPLRKQLVGLLPVDRVTRLPEGSQIVEFCDDDALPPPPVPMLGHVTSSYRSAELGRTFALALVKAGQSRIGETLHVPVEGTLVPVEVTGSVLVDPEGARRDG
ncbi:glycine cleavage system T protein (aminomethyltransferase) [Mycobacterium sp. JS623]|uniref:2Fe-2S iron-sulfur cluster-binding protein n=1 Tax=Mycobacterium sp. JS623 TaxID=212767 RepID=UPI0002A54F10|nr:2Fe-2S iron-sulfur cluster-binding protein [Mycobacterium sp. JS623]AGB24034.1 glycine cleavage system T protein (aminomethyltransferase) [Mycobacterium sp. JS623]